jgi:hypothetical protein
MEQDIKDVVGILMRVLGGGEVSDDELDDLGSKPRANLRSPSTRLTSSCGNLRTIESCG